MTDIMTLLLHVMFSCTCVIIVVLSLISRDVTAVRRSKLGDANTEMASGLYRSIATHIDPWRNFLFSPLGVSSALALVYVGSKGRTKEQLAAVMRLSDFADDLEVYEAFRSVQVTLNRERNNYTFSLANRLYGRKEVAYAHDYSLNANRYFSSSLESLDFAGNVEGSRQTINSWVSEKTRQKVNDILPYNSITYDTSLLLVSGATFRSRWEVPFQPDQTSWLPFRITKQESRSTQMMQLDNVALGYYNALELSCQVLELPFLRHQVSMIILLPNEAEGQSYTEALTRTEDRLAHHITGLLGRLRAQWLNVKLPRFVVEQEVPLKQYLQLIGADDLFDDKMADLDGIGLDLSTQRLYVREFVHKVHLSFNEFGTDESLPIPTAPSHTVIHGPAPYPPPIQFNVDRPFAFYLIEKSLGNVLFFGRLVRPTERAEVIGKFNANDGNASVSRDSNLLLIAMLLLGLLVAFTQRS